MPLILLCDQLFQWFYDILVLYVSYSLWYLVRDFVRCSSIVAVLVRTDEGISSMAV